jgi:hypothetical protein
MRPLNQLSEDEFRQLAQRAARMPDAPAAWVQAAVTLGVQALMAPAMTLGQVLRSALHRVQAELSFDSGLQPNLTLGMRSMDGSTRHLIFSAPGHDIDLRISPAAEHFVLTGQILGRDPRGSVELTLHGDDARSASDVRVVALDEMAEFVLDGVPAGTCGLCLHLDQAVIELPPMHIGARPP